MEEKKRLVVVFASQRVLEAIALIIGAHLNKAAEVVGISAQTPASSCEKLLRGSATALIHETVLALGAHEKL